MVGGVWVIVLPDGWGAAGHQFKLYITDNVPLNIIVILHILALSFQISMWFKKEFKNVKYLYFEGFLETTIILKDE